ncbi:MAG TPA: beta-N-acetylhexosaminidase [Burkholderiales bacterium]|nr:beta-N-acetylhexosaminidase [Burkholderiales bacterium]
MAAQQLPLGVVIADLNGTRLSDEDRARLAHPQIGGVILFTRNFESVEQIAALCADIRTLRTPELIIAVDHEGGRVQRFRPGFTAIPAMRKLGALWDRDQQAALAMARDCGYVLATELTACGVNLSFTPVLDVDYGESGVIGDRAFHRDPQAIAALAAALQCGLGEGGLATCGKHFPGHGYVRADSHLEVPVDEREYAEIAATDMAPYPPLIAAGLASIMPAHVIYPKVDSHPAGFSRRWIAEILRGDYAFDGLVFSDDLSMEGAKVAGGVVERGQAALAAGCDMVLVCNDLAAADELLAGLHALHVSPVSPKRVALLAKPAPAASRAALEGLPPYVQARKSVNAFAATF